MTNPCPEDLLGLRRAGGLDAAQARLLDAHLQSCAACALEEGLHEGFEKDGRPQPLDERLIARAVERTLSSRRRPRSRRSWSLATGVAAALVLTAGLASAAAWLHHRTTNRPTPPVSETVGASRPATPVPEAPTAKPELALPEPAPAEQPRTAPARPRTHRRSVVSGEPPAAPALDLEALFAAANEARRAGQVEHAGELYAELQRRFPDSRQALLSQVSYGRILLDHGRAAQALAQFERHIRAASGGVLAAEAFYGQARALTQLHREAEARRCWSDLLARFPDSIYADVARAQLGARP